METGNTGILLMAKCMNLWQQYAGVNNDTDKTDVQSSVHTVVTYILLVNLVKPLYLPNSCLEVS